MWPQVLEQEVKRHAKDGDWHSPINGKSKTFLISPKMWYILDISDHKWDLEICVSMCDWLLGVLWVGQNGALPFKPYHSNGMLTILFPWLFTQFPVFPWPWKTKYFPDFSLAPGSKMYRYSDFIDPHPHPHPQWSQLFVITAHTLESLSSLT